MKTPVLALVLCTSLLAGCVGVWGPEPVIVAGPPVVYAAPPDLWWYGGVYYTYPFPGAVVIACCGPAYVLGYEHFYGRGSWGQHYRGGRYVGPHGHRR